MQFIFDEIHSKVNGIELYDLTSITVNTYIIYCKELHNPPLLKSFNFRGHFEPPLLQSTNVLMY